MTQFYKLLFLSTLLMSTLITISSLSWISSWIGLESNLLSFIPLMKSQKNKFSSESISKYFMTQAMASFLLLFSVVVFSSSKSFNFSLDNITSMLMGSSLMMKMGAAPLHFWFPEVSSGISWNSNMILLTWQKIAPMMLISYLNIFNQLMFMFIMSSTIIGSMGGLNQICMRKILTYSSINHIGWMLAAMLCSLNTWMLYFSIYFIINIMIMKILKSYKIFFISQMGKIKNKSMKMLFMMNFFSLGGLPPFLGFLPKWITINNLNNNNYYMFTVILIIFTLISLFFYLRITFASFSLYSNMSYTYNYKMNFINSAMSLMSLLMMPLSILLTIWLL
uniref:NADH-ubiquinone oxidoreductase chain 2 n=1 Tax=Dryocoetes villosus TaxID=1367338 RepID=A0A343A4X6_9CUCU|nr:NADH dehydrogenase subunit 2 [Dryocoetes villosus]AOY39604.1 NADH dehydrogenase subunit 2 [Dryocoetes villosus]